jgi:hypothetical protein
MRRLFFLFLLTLISCGEISPPETFCCKINGKTYRPNGSSKGTLGSNALQVSWDEKSGVLFVRSRDYSEVLNLLIVFENKVIKEGKINLSNLPNKSKIYYSTNINYPISSQLISESGFFEITKKNGSLITGKFEFTVYDINQKKEIKGRKGIFNDLSFFI